jgi:hypothetical protein
MRWHARTSVAAGKAGATSWPARFERELARCFIVVCSRPQVTPRVGYTKPL